MDPLTKKQFTCFDNIEDLKKSLIIIQDQQLETKADLDRVVKRNDMLDYTDKKVHDLETEVMVIKAMHRNENTQMLERYETLNQRLKAAQTDVHALARFDEKLRKVQQSVMDVTDEYNQTVTVRLKEVS